MREETIGSVGPDVASAGAAAGAVVASAFRSTLPVVLAQATGALRARELALTVVPAESSDDQLDRLSTGAVDVCHTALDNVVAWSRRAPVRVIAVIDLGVAHELVARAPIDAPDRLRGATIGVDSTGNGLVVLLETMLREAGLEGDAYALRPVGGLAHRARALEAGEIDACLLAGAALERAQAAGHHRLLAVRDRFPAYPAIALVAHAPLTGARRVRLTAYVAALRAAVHSDLEDPATIEAAAAILGTPSVQASAWLRTERTRMTGIVADAAQAAAVIADGLRDTGRLGAGETIDGYVDLLMEGGRGR